MGTFKRGDWGLKLLSLLVAVVLWAYVSNENNPVKERVFKDLPIDVRGLPSGLAVSELPGNVSLKVQAGQSVISELNPGAIEVFADFSGVQPGKRQVHLQVQVPADVKVLSLTPEKVTAKVESLAEKQVPVRIRTEDAPEKGYKILSIRTKPDEVIVRGPKSVVDKVRTANVDVHLKDKNSSFSETVPVRVTDDLGIVQEDRLVKRIPSMIEIFVSVVPDLPSKKVQVVPTLKGDPEIRYSVSMTVIDPPVLVISGRGDVINTIEKITTKPIDITGANKDVYVDIEPELPAGVFSNRQSVKVLVKIEKQEPR